MLRLEKARIQAALHQQFMVRASLGDPVVNDEEDLVCMPDG